MTTENIVQDTEESRIAQQKRETLHSLLYIMAECAPSAEKFMGIDVKALARKVDEAYDQLGLKVTTDSGSVSPLTTLLNTPPLSDNVLTMYAGSTGERTVCAEGVKLGSSFKASKKEYAKGSVFGMNQEQIDLINRIQKKAAEILEAHASLFMSIRDRQTFLLEVVTSWQAVLDGPALLSAEQAEEATTNRDDAQEELKSLTAAARFPDDIRSGIMELERLKSL